MLARDPRNYAEGLEAEPPAELRRRAAAAERLAGERLVEISRLERELVVYRQANESIHTTAAEEIRRNGELRERVRELAAVEATPADAFLAFMERQVAWSRATFGRSPRTKGTLEHLLKELVEIERNPSDLTEWGDVAILAIEGFHRHGGTAAGFLPLLEQKQAKNMARAWPATPEDQACEHDRTGE